MGHNKRKESTQERVHDRWIRQLKRTWPEGVPAREPAESEEVRALHIEPWPETYIGGCVRQCLHCHFYVTLSGPLGADWGACTNQASQYDGILVFEHWTCSGYRQGDGQPPVWEPGRSLD
jgi:hypothetical protein